MAGRAWNRNDTVSVLSHLRQLRLCTCPVSRSLVGLSFSLYFCFICRTLRQDLLIQCTGLLFGGNLELAMSGIPDSWGPIDSTLHSASYEDGISFPWQIAYLLFFLYHLWLQKWLWCKLTENKFLFITDISVFNVSH